MARAPQVKTSMMSNPILVSDDIGAKHSPDMAKNETLKTAPVNDTNGSNEGLSPAEIAKMKRLEVLKMARAKALEVRAEKKKQRESLIDTTKKQRELLREIRKEKVAVQSALLEKEKSRVERLKKTVDIYDKAGVDEEEEEEEEEVVVKPKKVVKPKPKKRIVYVTESESEEEEVIIKRKPKAKAPAMMVEDPVKSLTKTQIRDDLRKIQMEMLSKSLFGQ